MKKAIAASLLALSTFTVSAEIFRLDLNELSGQTIDAYDSYLSATMTNSIFDEPGYSIREARAVFNFEQVEFGNDAGVLEVRLYGHESMFINMRNSRTSYTQEGYGNWEDPDFYMAADMGDTWEFQFNLQNTGTSEDYVTFGSGSYLEFTGTLGEIVVPETGTFALFMAGLVGLSIRRQQKAQR